MPGRIARWAGAGLAASILACGSGEETAAGGRGPEMTAAALRGATYRVPHLPDLPVTLAGGEFVDPARRITVFLLPEYAVGDLDGRGAPDAAVLLSANTGGSGVFEYIAAVIDRAGEPTNVATTLLGDRVQVDRIRIQNGRIRIDLTAQGPGDPMCCPTLRMTRRFRLMADSLVEIELAPSATDLP